MKGSRQLLLTISCLLALFLMVAGADVMLWKTLDLGREPIRALALGDQDYYILRIHSTLVAEKPIGSPFFLEHASSHPRYLLFDNFIVLLGKLLIPFIGLNAVVWTDLLRILAITALFFEWRYVFRRWAGLSNLHASVTALCVNLWQEPFTFLTASALDSWFMPITFAGLLCLINCFRPEPKTAHLAWCILATALFAVHPISFAWGTLAAGILWLHRIWRERSRVAVKEALVWALPTFFLGLALFGSFAFPDPLTVKVAAETLARNGSLETNLPVMPLEDLMMLGLLALILILRQHDRSRRAIWDALSASTVVMLLGLSSNILTGHYFLGDHFVYFERIVAVAAGALALTMPIPASDRREKTIALIAGSTLAVYGLGLLVVHPIRSWLSLGVTLPYFLAYVAMVWVVFGRQLPRVFLPPRFTLTAVVALSLLYPAVFLWRLERGYVPLHARAEEARPLLETLSKLPPGVVLSDDALSGLIALYTPQRPYWSSRAFIDEASNEELRSRWRDALVFFAEQSWTKSIATKVGLFGNEDQFCDGLSEKTFYGPLAHAGIVPASLCHHTLSEFAWTEFTENETVRALARQHEAGWEPSYRLDMLVIDRVAGERLPPALMTVFEPIEDDGRFVIYRYRKKR